MCLHKPAKRSRQRGGALVEGMLTMLPLLAILFAVLISRWPSSRKTQSSSPSVRAYGMQLPAGR